MSTYDTLAKVSAQQFLQYVLHRRLRFGSIYAHDTITAILDGKETSVLAAGDVFRSLVLDDGVGVHEAEDIYYALMTILGS